jgi:hypothetical protein
MSASQRDVAGDASGAGNGDTSARNDDAHSSDTCASESDMAAHGQDHMSSSPVAAHARDHISSDDSHDSDSESSANEYHVPPPVSLPRTRLQKGIKKPQIYTDGTIRYGLLTSTGEPNSLDEALSDEKWRHAMEEEYGALIQNKTWHLVPPSSNKNLIDCK